MDEIIKNIQHKLNARQKRRALPVLKIVRRTLIAERKVFYGGMAMNLYLPKRDRFYHPTKEIPDFDVYSASAKRFVTSLADKLIRAGYKQIEVRCALHPGTYKLSWDSMSILDVTNVSTTEMRRLHKHSQRVRGGILLCPLSLLKANAYLELASPDTASYRWKKVYRRVRLLEKNTLAPSVTTQVYTSQHIPSVSLKNHVVTGIHAARHYLKRVQLGDGEVQLLGVPSDFLVNTAIRETPGVVTYNRMTPLELNIKNQWYPYIRVHDISTQCVAFDPQQTNTKPRYASLFHVLYVGYMEDYAFGKTDIPIRALLRLVNKKRFHSECVGTAPVIQNLKRARSTWTY